MLLGGWSGCRRRWGEQSRGAWAAPLVVAGAVILLLGLAPVFSFAAGLLSRFVKKK